MEYPALSLPVLHLCAAGPAEEVLRRALGDAVRRVVALGRVNVLGIREALVVEVGLDLCDRHYRRECSDLHLDARIDACTVCYGLLRLVLKVLEALVVTN